MKNTATAEEIRAAFGIAGSEEAMTTVSEMLDEQLTPKESENILNMCLNSIDSKAAKNLNNYQKTLLLTRQIYKAGFLQAIHMTADSLTAAYSELFGAEVSHT